jgi:isopentenyl-diphosphate Delta-isomerase
MSDPEIVHRKKSHLELCASEAVEFRKKTTLLENVELLPSAIIETSLDEIDLSTTVFGKRLEYPVMISGMTGGSDEGGRFNREVAALAERLGLGFGVGSQRVMFSHPEVQPTFEVRDVAPHVLLFGNIGIAQAREMSTREIVFLADSIGADAICIHFNAAMEIIQEHGDHNFRGSLATIERLTTESPVEIVAKETGCGFTRENGVQLTKAGVRWVDVSGAGGTSWVGVETLRNRAQRELGETFWDWGLPTAASLCELQALDLELIASGGIRSGLDAAKTIALGARMVGIALPVLRAWVTGGISEVERYLSGFCEQLRIATMLCGCQRLDELTGSKAVINGKLLEWVTERRLRVGLGVGVHTGASQVSR